MRLVFFILSCIPNFLSSQSLIDSLKTLDLQHKNLTAIPASINLKNLKSLHIGYNPIVKLQPDISQANHLTELSINNAPQFNIDVNIDVLKKLKLESLSINNSALLYLPIEFAQIKTLQNLSLANNYIKEIPTSILLSANYFNLNLAGNQISKLPKEISLQQKLHTLDLSYNPCINNAETYLNLIKINNLKTLNIKGALTLPSDIWILKSIETLDISDGEYTSVSLVPEPEKHNIVSLSAINCNQLDFTSLYPILSSPTLKEIKLGGDKFYGFTNVSISNNVTSLSLSGNNLEHFSFTQVPKNITEINLDFKSINCASELVSTLSKCNNITNLNLSNCNLTILPAQSNQLKNVETLNLSGNQIQNINELTSLKNLKTLNVSSCGLSQEQINTLKKELPNTEIINDEYYSKPELDNLKPQTENFSISPSAPQKIITQNGTQITIPKNSLVYANGKPVKENTNISYTSYYSLADIVASGVNMNYETKDSSAPFSSAGMFKLLANVNGEPVQLKKGAEIKVEFKSIDPDQSYNYYSYDTITKTWTDIGKDSVTTVKVKKEEDTTKTANNIINSSNPIVYPQAPLFYKNHSVYINWSFDKKNKLNGNFHISAIYKKHKEANDTSKNENYFNEIKALEKHTWKVDADKMNLVIKAFSKQHELFTHNTEVRRFGLRPRFLSSKTRTDKQVEFELIADKGNDNFIFRFYDEIDTIDIHAYPQVDAKNADRAQKNIKKMFNQYELIAKDRKIASEYRLNKFKNAYSRYKINLSESRMRIEQLNKDNIANLLNTSVNSNSYNITRILTLQGFGFYNCDRPIRLENPIVLTPRFINEDGKKIYINNFQVVDKKENMVLSYGTNRPIKISGNSIISFICQGDYKQGASTYLAKLNTFDFKKRNGEFDIIISKLDPNITTGQLNEYLLSGN